MDYADKVYGANYRGEVPCNSLLKITQEDLVEKQWFKYPDEGATEVGIICPVCNSFTVVKGVSVKKKILDSSRK